MASVATEKLLVGQGQDCVIILTTPGVMKPDEAEALGLALIRGADRARRPRDAGECKECGGRGMYWTEWSDKADADPAYSSMVVLRPVEPDGTVLVLCHVCAPVRT